jgi:hypothetical protein
MVPALYSALTVNSLAHSYVRRAPWLELKNNVLAVAPRPEIRIRTGPPKTTLEVEQHQQSAQPIKTMPGDPEAKQRRRYEDFIGDAKAN